MSVAAARDYLQRALAELDEPPTPNVMRVRAGQDIALALKIAAPHTRVLVEVGKDIIYDGFDLGGLDYQGITVEPDTSALDGVGTVTAEMAEALIKLRATARPYDCALAATGPASRLNFRGVQFLPNPKSPSTAMVILGLDTATDPLQQPDGLTFDQCLGLGDPVTGCKRMFMANTRTITITRSACDHIFADTDAQAVATVCGPGPFIIRNNVWCSAGENFIAGGGNSNTPAMVAQYVEFLRNVCTARPEWRDKVRFPHLVRKNAFELKACAKALVKGNVFENVWQGGGQIGFAIVLTPRSQDGNSPWAGVTDVDMSHNLVRHCAGGVNILGTDNENPSQFAERIALSQMLFYDVSSAWGSGNGRLFQISAGARDVSIDHVTADKVGNSFLTLDGAAIQRLVITNSILPEGQYGIKGSGTVEGAPSWLAFTSPDSTFSGNVIHMTTSARNVKYPGVNAKLAAGVSAIGSDFKPAALNLPAGADIDAIKAELPAGVL
jgi:hypothetical protein